MRAGQAAAAAVGKSRAGGGQRQVEEDQGVRDQPDGLLEGASGRGDEEWGVLLLRLLRRDCL